MSENNNKDRGDINITTGTYNEGGNFTTTNYGNGISNVANTVGDIVYSNESNSDTKKLAEMFSQLQDHLTALPESTPEEKETKEDAADAVQTLQQEVEAVKKDPEHKPSRVTLKGLEAAFKKVGGPVLSTAISIMGFPAVGAAINQFADKLKTE